jgi:O-antigen/teichoic acid export membrane protein
VSPDDPRELDSGAAQQQRVLKNASLLVAAQLLATPVSVLVNAMMARYLGPAAFGDLYLVLTFGSFGLLIVDWGQGTMLSGEVARARSRAGELLGSALLWRAATSALVYVVFGLAARLLHYEAPLRDLLSLALIGFFFNTLTGACQDIIRGFERTDIAAAGSVGWQLLNALLTIPVLLLGGGTRAVLLAQGVCALLTLIVTFLALRPLGIWPVTLRRETSRELVRKGTPFVLFSFALLLQQNIDAAFMSKLATATVIGWHAVARKLFGVLLYPANALIVALYPTLCRLHTDNQPEFRRLTRSALSNTAVLAVPLALGCFTYPELGIQLFNPVAFGPAQDNLRILAFLLFLGYLSMPMSSALVAAGRQRPWAMIQLSCAAVSLIADPLLIPWFQRHAGNGGLGVCAAAVISEVLMVAAGVALLPRGIADWLLARRVLLALLAGGIMWITAHLLRGLTPWFAAPLSVLSYLLAARGLGAIDASQSQAVRALIARRVRPSASNA